MSRLYVFNAKHEPIARPDAVFSTMNRAREALLGRGLSGCLTEYRLDELSYDTALRIGLFHPKQPHQRTAHFIQQFTSAGWHAHFERGIPESEFSPEEANVDGGDGFASAVDIYVLLGVGVQFFPTGVFSSAERCMAEAGRYRLAGSIYALRINEIEPRDRVRLVAVVPS